MISGHFFYILFFMHYLLIFSHSIICICFFGGGFLTYIIWFLGGLNAYSPLIFFHEFTIFYSSCFFNCLLCIYLALYVSFYILFLPPLLLSTFGFLFFRFPHFTMFFYGAFLAPFFAFFFLNFHIIFLNI
jgi:hypothetical protein